MNALALVTSSNLPALVDRASRALAAARSSAEVLEARDMASFAYDAAKRVARLTKAKDAHDTLIAAAYRMQADALEIESRAKRRIADEYDAAQERGEVSANGQHASPVPGENRRVSTTDLGFTRKAIHEARQVRNAEQESPGIIRRSLNALVERGQEPSRAALRQAVAHVAQHGYRPPAAPAASRRNPLHEPNADFDRTARVAGLCVSLVEKTECLTLTDILSGCTTAGMRARTLSDLRSCRDRLCTLLEAHDAAEA